MPLRLLEATIANREIDNLPALLADVPVVDLWSTTTEGVTGLVRIVLDAQYAETVSDLLVSNFGSDEGFRITLVSVEGTVPAVEGDGVDDKSGSGKSRIKKIGIARVSREELHHDIAEASGVTALYVVMVALSTVVAAVGLIRGDVAIIVGAMVIAPLLGPNVALALAAALGDAELAKRSLKAIGVGIVVAGLGSFVMGLVIGVDPTAEEIMARTRADVGDIALALAAGTAGTLAFTSGVSEIVVGVMVAVALLPPLVVAGLLAGAGHLTEAEGALILALTNVTCINLAAVGTFFLLKVRPRTWWEASRARRATRLAVAAWIFMLLVLVALMLTGRVLPN